MAMRLCKRNPSFLYKSYFPFSFSLLFSSSSTERKVKNDLTVYDFLLHKHQFSPETASQVASVLTRIKNPEKSDSILSFLKESGFSKSQLEKVVKTKPGLLAASLENTIKPKFKIFQEFGFSAEDITEIISSDPSHLHRSADNRVRPSLSLLKRLLGSSAEVTKVLKNSGLYLKKDLEKTMLPNIEFLKSCGVGMDQIIKKIYKFPWFLMFSPKKMKFLVKTVDEMGTCRSSKLFIHAVHAVGSMSNENWELKLRHFRNLGFLEDDILKMFHKAPQVFSVSQKKISKVLEVLLATGKYDLSCIVKTPISLTFSVEKKIKPRMQVLGILESKNLIGKWPSISTVITIPDSKFVEKFVQPYFNEVGEVCMANSALNRKTSTKISIKKRVN